ncbi:hypothetical protein AGMMS50229_19550 [Campylobacterota bacterium]|nr:hypothetical protein AGMMS50229_19550 [Campylobacterota bacterium]
MAYRLFLSQDATFSVCGKRFYPKFDPEKHIVALTIEPDGMVVDVPYGNEYKTDGISLVFEHNKGRFAIISTHDNAKIILLKEEHGQQNQ